MIATTGDCKFGWRTACADLLEALAADMAAFLSDLRAGRQAPKQKGPVGNRRGLVICSIRFD